MPKLETEYCPLCGAHKFEHGEGEVTDDDVIQWQAEIFTLLDRLKHILEVQRVR